jgi:uncharacterized protein (TIGR02444 family)
MKKPIDAALLWQYSLQKYAYDEVKDACLSLQDDYAYNVNLLLLCMLCDSLGVTLIESEIDEIRTRIKVSDSALIEHRHRRRHAKTIEQSNSIILGKDCVDYQALLKQELKLEAAQQELIVHAYTALESPIVHQDIDGVSSSLCHYMDVMTTSSDTMQSSRDKNKTKQERLIKVLRKHV